jgi:hypothetical protein
MAQVGRSVDRMVMALAAAAGLAAGCTGVGTDPLPTPPGSATPASSPTLGPVRLHVRLGTGQSFTVRPAQADGCPGFDALVTLGQDRQVRLSAYAEGCDTTGNARPGNGRHGAYRSAADVPADRLASSVKVHTALGDAVVFTQPYYECTNSCHDYTEPVAVITLDHPDDPRYPTLVACSEKGTIGLDQLETVLRDQLQA